METNYFTELYGKNVNDHIEVKGKFSYLSWPYAVAELNKVDASANWEVKRFDYMPYLKTPLGYFVEVAVTCKGITKSQIHPVLNNQNKPILEPTVFDINTSIQRCLVKAIALHGLGLYVYAGEDLPEQSQSAIEEKQNQLEIQLKSAQSLPELAQVWQTVPKAQQKALTPVKDAMKAKLTPQQEAA